MLSPLNHIEPAQPVHKFWLMLEWAILFIGVPTAVATGWLPIWVIPLLLIMAIGCGLTFRWGHNIRLRDLLFKKVSGAEWRRMLIIYMAALPGLVCLLWLIKPVARFSLMCQHTKIWLLVMFAYPIVSVLPQELIYRVFFFERYRPLFGQGIGMTVASAAAFGFGHIIFHNWPAVVLTSVGGWLFANTYQRTSSWLLVAVEHALYGYAIFTIGYGEYFLDGTLRLVP